MEGPPLGPGGEDITWPDQVAPRGRKASSTRKIKPQNSNLLLFGSSPPRSRFLVIGVFVVFLPPPRPPPIRTSVRMMDAIVGWVGGERKDTPTTRCTGWRGHGRRRRRRLRIRNGWRRRWRGRDHRIGLCRRGVPVVPSIDTRCNGGVRRSECFHCAKALSCVAVGHFNMIRHTSLHRLRIPLVALNHRVKLSQRRQVLGPPVPVGLTDASGRGYCLRKLLLGSLQL